MTDSVNPKQYDLEERGFNFARRCRDFVKRLPRTICNIEYGKQLVRSSSSQAANYIEANEHLSRKDFLHRAKISRKEAKESRLFLRLCSPGNNPELIKEQKELVQEALELTKIYGSMVTKKSKTEDQKDDSF